MTRTALLCEQEPNTQGARVKTHYLESSEAALGPAVPITQRPWDCGQVGRLCGSAVLPVCSLKEFQRHKA